MYDDPGWKDALRRLRVAFIPFAGPFLARRGDPRRPHDAITAFRVIYLSLIGALLVWGLLLLFIVSADRRWRADQDTWFVWVVLVAGLLSVVGVQVVRARKLAVTSPQELAASYRGATFIGIAVAAAAALAGFVGSFIMGTYWIYLVGMAFALAGLALVGPTRREIARRQEQIAAQGSPLSLGAALLVTPDRPNG